MIQELLKQIRKYAYKEGDFTLSSGLKSDYFIDMSNVTYRSNGARLISLILDDYLPPLDAIGGPSSGADPIVASYLCYKGGKKGFVVKKDGSISGNLTKGNKVVIVEDVVTTGQQLLNAINRVEAVYGAKVLKAVAVVDRLQGASKLLKYYNFQAITTIDEIRQTNYNDTTKEVDIVEEAVKLERLRCAKLAWKMQMEFFGGGTAIGNAIQDGVVP